MKTFSLNEVSGSDPYSIMVWDVIRKNLGYFRKFNRDRWQEAVHKTYIAALDHRDDSYGDILPYIKKLARTILMTKSAETSFSTFNDDGEVNFVFFPLQDSFSTDHIDGYKELFGVFEEMYLKYTDNFMKLRNLFSEGVLVKKEIRVRDKNLSSDFMRILEDYDYEFVFKVLYDFFNELPNLTNSRVTGKIKEVILKPTDFSILDKIQDTPTIMDSAGRLHYIEKTSLSMVENPDYFKWDIIGNYNTILKTDISLYMSYMYEEVYPAVTDEISTRYVTRCGSKVKFVTPSGVAHIGIEPEKFLSIVRVELILNLLANNIGSIVALSPDYVYFKQFRSFECDKIRVRFKNGRLMDLPVFLHKKRC